MKYIINIFALIILFQFSLSAQEKEQVQFIPKGNEKDKIEFQSMKDLRAYQEAVTRGEVKPLKKEEMEKWYNKFVEDIDQKYHSSSKPKYGHSDTLPCEITANDSVTAKGSDLK